VSRYVLPDLSYWRRERLFFHTLELDTEILEHYAKELGMAGPSESIGALARAIAHSPSWASMAEATLVVRTEPPCLAVMTSEREEEVTRMEVQARSLRATLPYVRLVSFPQAMDDCEELGKKLVNRFGRDELKRFRFVALPRGGFVVLGLMATAMGLTAEQLAPGRGDEPLVVVDDCAITGARFRAFLECHGKGRRITFVHLHSPPELRQAIESTEEGVVACLTAHDLRLRGGEDWQEDRRQRWRKRLTGRRYWLGPVEHVCYPWNEPNRSVWIDAAQQIEQAWRVIPPELCVRNRATSTPAPIAIQDQPRGKGPLRPSPRVLFGQWQGKTVLADQDSGRSFLLEGAAADTWRGIVEHGTVDGAAADLARVYDAPRHRLEDDAREFVAELEKSGLLEYEEKQANEAG
jgi:hypothetical protein